MKEEVKEEQPKKSNFIFGDLFGTWMSKISLRTQYESSMLGCAFILIFLCFFIVYWAMSDMTLWWKFIYIGNGLCGIMILWSNVVTTFQQYQSYREIENVTSVLKTKQIGMNEW